MSVLVTPARDSKEGTRGPTQGAALKAFYATRSQSGIKDAGGDLRVFGKFCELESEVEIETLLFGPAASLEKTQALVSQYRDHLRSLDLAWGTINRRLTVVRTLNRFARLVGMVSWEIDVSAGDREFRRNTRGANKQARRQVERMSRESRQARRDRGIVLLADCLGMTKTEIVALDLEGYHPDPSAPGIGSVGDLMLITKDVKTAMDAWVEVRGFKPGPLFTTLDGTDARLDPAGLIPLVRPDAVGS